MKFMRVHGFSTKTPFNATDILGRKLSWEPHLPDANL